MKKFGAFMTSLFAAFFVYGIHGMVFTAFLRAYPNIDISLLFIAIDGILVISLMIAAALLTYRTINKKIGQSKRPY